MDAVEEIKQRLNIEDVIGEYVELKRAGRNFKGLSPFGNEKSPSFIVSPEKQIWHDFSSGKGGNMFSFVMEMEGLEFKGALELLARKAGVELEQMRPGSGSAARGKAKERLYAVNELAAKFYQVHFSKSQTALEYIFKKRGFSKAVALQFQIGYSPNNGNALTSFLLSKNFTHKEIKDAGLATERYGRMQDMFRGRVQIALHDATGRVIGFTARLLEEDPNAPKYINTPQTQLYDKSRHVYGLHLAKDAIRKTKRAVIVEGNLDVIASHQAGVREVVATAGTAMTEYHLKALSRFATDVRLAFDQDAAGINATERAIPIASKAKVSISIITVPEGKDPDELIKKGPKLWTDAIEKNEDALDWLIAQYEKRADLNTYAGREQFKTAVLGSVKRLESAGERGVYSRKVAKILGYDEEAIKDELKMIKQGRKTYKTVRHVPQKVDAQTVEYKKIQDHMLCLVLILADLRTYLEPINVDMLPEEPAQKLLSYLQAHPDFDRLKHKGPALKEIAEYDSILLLQYEELYQGLELVELQYEAARLQARLIERYVNRKKTDLAIAMRASDESATDQLLQKAKDLDKLLKKYHTL